MDQIHSAPARRKTNQQVIPPPSVSDIVRGCRLRVAEHYRAGARYAQDSADCRALIAIACSSIVLEGHILAGALKPEAMGQLVEIANHLGVSARCGADVVTVCTNAGPALYDEVDYILERRAAREGAAE